MTDKRTSKRKQKGQLYHLEKYGWHGRWYATVEGERVRVSRCLHTEHKTVASKRLARMIAEGSVSREEAQRPETFEEAARRVLDSQRQAGMVTHKDRLHRLETYIFPTLAKMQPSTIKASHVRSLLDEARNAGKSRQTMVHIKNDVSVVLGELWSAELLPENVCKRVQVPEALPAVSERSKKERAVLTDEELVQYLAWEHPMEQHRESVLERQVMACVARMFGGLRTSDLHSVRWEGFDLVEFDWGYAPRKKGSRLAKGGKPQKLVIPEILRPILAMWREHSKDSDGKKPTTGLLFPKRRGEGVGVDGRKSSSHADAFRRDLARVFGIEVWNAQTGVFERSKDRDDPTADRPLTARETVLLTETDYSKPVDFHSWRRAFNQALADAGVNSQTSMALAGHSSLQAHERYLRNSDTQRIVPFAALPVLGNGQKGMGKKRESVTEATNTNDEDPPKTPLKLIGPLKRATLGAGCWRFKSSHPDYRRAENGLSGASTASFEIVTCRSLVRNEPLLLYCGMSFYDDLIEPVAIESAAHFFELVRSPAERDEEQLGSEPGRERAERRRPLPRDLGH